VITVANATAMVAERRGAETIRAVFRNGGCHRPERHVACRIDHAEADVGERRPRDLSCRRVGWGGEGHNGERDEQDRREGEIRPELSPAGTGPVCQHSHHRVVDGVPQASHKEDHSRRCGADAEHVGIEEQQERRHEVVDHVLSEIPDAVGEDLFFPKTRRIIHMTIEA
jgi:hypothetical protein